LEKEEAGKEKTEKKIQYGGNQISHKMRFGVLADLLAGLDGSKSFQGLSPNR